MPSIPTIALTFSTLRPEMTAIYKSDMLLNLCKTFLVSGGSVAKSGCGAIGDNVPS